MSGWWSEEIAGMLQVTQVCYWSVQLTVDGKLLWLYSRVESVLDYKKFGEHNSSAAIDVIIQFKDTYTANDIMRVVTRKRCLYEPPAYFQLLEKVGDKSKSTKTSKRSCSPYFGADQRDHISLVCNLTWVRLRKDNKILQHFF